MAFIPQEVIDAVIARNEISEVVSQYVQLERKGSQNLFGLCPFHGEKTPSFSVNTSKQFFYCFGCHAGGNVIKFIELMENLSFPDAVAFLAKRVGMEIEQEDDEQARSRQRRYKALQACLLDAARFFYKNYKGPAGHKAQNYMLKQRRLSPRIITSFGIGYADDSWDSLAKYLNTKGHSSELAQILGLIRQSQRGTNYDFFRDRVIFPVFDHLGRLRAFGGRTLGQDEAKYINSPDSQIYNKGKYLYALNFARKTRLDYLILCEGYMDTIALHEQGFDNAVAGLGTALTKSQARLLAQYTTEVILAYDSDEAGQNACQKALDLLQREKVKCKVLIMPQGLDPDEYIHHYGKERFQTLISQSLPALDYKLYRAREDNRSPQGSLNVLGFQEAATDVLAEIDNAVVRELYAEKIAQEIVISPASIMEVVDKKRSGKPSSKLADAKDVSTASARSINIEQASVIYLSALIEDNRILEDAISAAEIKDFPDGLQIYAAEILRLAKAQKLEMKDFLNLPFLEQQDMQELKQAILAQIAGMGKNKLRSPTDYAADALKQMRIKRAEERKSTLLSQLQAEPANEAKLHILAEIKDINDTINDLRNEVKYD